MGLLSFLGGGLSIWVATSPIYWKVPRCLKTSKKATKGSLEDNLHHLTSSEQNLLTSVLIIWSHLGHCGSGTPPKASGLFSILIFVYVKTPRNSGLETSFGGKSLKLQPPDPFPPHLLPSPVKAVFSRSPWKSWPINSCQLFSWSEPPAFAKCSLGANHLIIERDLDI